MFGLTENLINYAIVCYAEFPPNLHALCRTKVHSFRTDNYADQLVAPANKISVLLFRSGGSSAVCYFWLEIKKLRFFSP